MSARCEICKHGVFHFTKCGREQVSVRAGQMRGADGIWKTREVGKCAATGARILRTTRCTSFIEKD